MRSLPSLSPALPSITKAQRDAALALADAAADADGQVPLNEEARLQLSAPGDGPGATHWLATRPGGHLAGYAQWQPAHSSGQLVVHPEHRRRGVGTALLRALSDAAPTTAVWAFGDLPEAQGFAAARGLVPGRRLLVMERTLAGVPAPQPPPGVRLRGFTDADADAFLAVNAAAFAGHPEQGHFGADDLRRRQAEPWWDSAGLILAEDAAGVAGFHWTKHHDAATGEVYVIGVHPRASGRGLGRVLLDAGLAHLAASGHTRVILYVEADNAPAVRLYERNGFAVYHTDTLYVPATDA